MIELWPLEWLWRPLCCCLPCHQQTYICPPCCPGRSLCLCSIMLSCTICPSAAPSPWITREERREGQRKENKHWPCGSFFPCNIYVCKSMRCGRNSEVVWLLLSRISWKKKQIDVLLSFYTFLNSETSPSLSRCLSLTHIFFLALNLGLNSTLNLMTHHVIAATSSENCI